MEKSPKHKISTVAIFVLVFSALLCDIIGLIPFAKDFMATLFWSGASFYFWKSGMGIFSGKKLAVMGVSWISAMIPYIQEIPIELTAGVIAIIIMTKFEEKTGLSIGPKMNKAPSKPHLNEGGVRLPSGR